MGCNVEFGIALPPSIHALGSIKDEQDPGQWLWLCIFHLSLSESSGKKDKEKYDYKICSFQQLSINGKINVFMFSPQNGFYELSLV